MKCDYCDDDIMSDEGYDHRGPYVFCERCMKTVYTVEDDAKRKTVREWIEECIHAKALKGGL